MANALGRLVRLIPSPNELEGINDDFNLGGFNPTQPLFFSSNPQQKWTNPSHEFLTYLYKRSFQDSEHHLKFKTACTNDTNLTILV